MDSTNEAVIVHPAWFKRAVDECQGFIGQLTIGNTSAPHMLPHFLDRLPSPTTVGEALALRWLLTELAIRLTAVLHARSLHACEKVCCLAGLRTLMSGGNRRLTDPRVAFREYVEILPPTKVASSAERLALRVKQIVDCHYGDRLRICDISRQLNQPSRQVTASFRRAFGMSVHDYLTEVRVQQAARLLAHTDLKVEAVALMVGYRSKKNLYHALRRFLGLTAGQLRYHPFAAGPDLLKVSTSLAAREANRRR